MKIILKFSTITLFLFCAILVSATPSPQLGEAYIAQYRSIAISEMERSGIPASIKLAQGLLESNWGRSELASLANNHFGIKCGGSWEGRTFHQEDDDRDEDGVLIESCFRAYEDSFDSYIAHSDFLLDPNKEYRYGFLFELETTDYRQWARGLREAGYATDSKYPQKLIQIIEQYKLYELDVLINTAPRQYADVSKRQNTKVNNHVDATASNINRYQIDYINGTKMTRAQGGETVLDLSKKLKVSWSQIIRHNEGITQEKQVLKQGEYVYIDRKPKSVKKGIKRHILGDSETMYDVAQIYGVDMKSIYRMNKIKSDDELYIGLELSLDKMISNKRENNEVAQVSKNRTKSKRNTHRKKLSEKSESKYLFDENWADRGSK